VVVTAVLVVVILMLLLMMMVTIQCAGVGTMARALSCPSRGLQTALRR
jgi:hypothetical protein